MRTLGIIIVLLLWFALGWKMCSDHEVCCGDGDPVAEAATTAPIAALSNACPIAFKYKNADPILCDNWSTYRDSLVGTLDDDDELQLTVYYTADETESVCNQRADATKALFANQLAPERIKVNCVQRGVNDQEKISAIDRTDFRKLVINANIKEVADRTLIYFKYGTSNKLDDSNVEAYLDNVANQVKASGQRISLTGHTDSDSSPQFNLGLGQRRADVIKNYLISKGVAANKITATSKGETEPIATNNTEDGKQKNRRTELQIIN